MKKIEDINIGDEYTNKLIRTISTVTDKTSNSIQLFNRTDRNNRYLSGEKDASGEVQMSNRIKGIDSYQWYTMKEFNDKFTDIKQAV